MSEQAAKKQTFSFRFRTPTDETKFLAKVKELGTTSSDLARDLIGLGLDREELGAVSEGSRLEIRPQIPEEFKRLVVKAAWSVIVALSPDLTEDSAAEFLRGVFGDFE